MPFATGLLTGEELFCFILEQQYDALVALIDQAIQFPRVALQTLKSVIQAVLKLTFEVIRAAIIIIEQEIIKFLNLDGIDLSKTKENFCNVAWECAAIKDKLYSLLGIAEDNPARTAYETFEEVICRQGLRNLFESWTQDTLLNNLDQTLAGYLDDIERVSNRVLNAVDDWIDYLTNTDIPFVNKTFLELMDELDQYAQCAFASCNWTLTSQNKKEELLDD